MMVVTVVAGVDMKKASEEALDAPILYKLMPTGITPQEHNGMGIPIREAVTIVFNPQNQAKAKEKPQ